jgi:hypothetical protein
MNKYDNKNKVKSHVVVSVLLRYFCLSLVMLGLILLFLAGISAPKGPKLRHVLLDSEGRPINAWAYVVDHAFTWPMRLDSATLAIFARTMLLVGSMVTILPIILYLVLNRFGIAQTRGQLPFCDKVITLLTYIMFSVLLLFFAKCVYMFL